VYPHDLELIDMRLKIRKTIIFVIVPFFTMVGLQICQKRKFWESTL